MSEGKPYYGVDQEGNVNGDIFCSRCAPVGIKPEHMEQEVDSPTHCTLCQTPLDHTLTEAGQEYVLNEIIDIIDTWYEGQTELRGKLWRDGWYVGLPHVALVLDWAHDMSNYGMEQSNSILVDWFIENIESEYKFVRRTSRLMWPPPEIKGDALIQGLYQTAIQPHSECDLTSTEDCEAEQYGDGDASQHELLAEVGRRLQ